jgi:hypothetical protein
MTVDTEPKKSQNETRGLTNNINLQKLIELETRNYAKFSICKQNDSLSLNQFRPPEVRDTHMVDVNFQTQSKHGI